MRCERRSEQQRPWRLDRYRVQASVVSESHCTEIRTAKKVKENEVGEAKVRSPTSSKIVLTENLISSLSDWSANPSEQTPFSTH